MRAAFCKIADNIPDIVKDVSADIKEVIHTKKTGLFRVVKYLDQHGQQTEREDQVYPDTDGVGVFEIMLKSGDKIALQMTVEQFKGHHLPHERNFVMLWEEYMELYAGKMTERSVFGTALKNHARLVNSCDHHTHLHIILHIIEEFQVFILKYARGEDAFLNPVSRVTKEDRMINFRGEMIRFLNDAKSRLDFIIMSIDQGNSSMDPLVKKHPKYGHDNIYTHYGREMIVTDFNPGIKNFNWDIVKQVASGEGFNHTVRKEARDLLACKAVYAPWNDHKFVFDPFPREKLPDLPHDRMSLNPHWDGKRKISKS